MVAGKIRQRPMESLTVVCAFEDHLLRFEPNLTEVCRVKGPPPAEGGRRWGVAGKPKEGIGSKN